MVMVVVGDGGVGYGDCGGGYWWMWCAVVMVVVGGHGVQR